QRGQGKEEMHTSEQVDTGGHHGRGMDQRAHRRRSGHGVRQPHMQGDLRRLASGTDKKEQRHQSRSRYSPNQLVTQMMYLRGELTEDYGAMPGGAQAPEESEDAQGEPSVTNTIDDECLVPGSGV